MRAHYDVAIATSWPTAFSIMKLPAKRRLYLVQGLETWSGPREKVEATYRLPLELVTVSPWLSRMMGERYGRHDVHEIHNGVRTDVFKPPATKDYSRVNILMIHSPLEIKGCVYAIQALSRLLDECPTAQVTLAGIESFSIADTRIRTLSRVSYEQLVRLYQDATIFVFPTIEEGWGMPVLEAMACGCAVVATKIGCMEVVHDGSNALVVRRRSADSILRALRLLSRSPERRRRLGEAGIATARRHTWDEPAASLDRLLRG